MNGTGPINKKLTDQILSFALDDGKSSSLQATSVEEGLLLLFDCLDVSIDQIHFMMTEEVNHAVTGIKMTQVALKHFMQDYNMPSTIHCLQVGWVNPLAQFKLQLSGSEKNCSMQVIISNFETKQYPRA